MVGLAQPITFDTAGDQSIVVTVFDGSNNSNAYAFVVTVEAAPTSSNSYAGVVLMVFVLLIFGGASVFGYGVWQRRLAFDLLLNRGLSEDEARGHMAMIAQRTKLSPISSAEAYAGLDQGEVVPADEREKAARQAEMDAIYGSNNDMEQTTAYAPPALVRHTCTACGALFEVDLPSGVDNAVVACPGCGTDQSIVSS